MVQGGTAIIQFRMKWFTYRRKDEVRVITVIPGQRMSTASLVKEMSAKGLLSVS
jgi:hypothetical protein